MQPQFARFLARYWLATAALCPLIFSTGFAQDSGHAPRNQLIPAPACLTLRGIWEGGYTPCTASAHADWLRDIRHWRTERRIRIGYDRARARRSCAAAVITSRRAQVGISRRPIETTSTASSCSWPRATIVPRPSASVAWSTRSNGVRQRAAADCSPEPPSSTTRWRQCAGRGSS